MNTSRFGFVRLFNAVSLQRKLLLFIVVTLSLIFAISSIFIYNLVRDTFMESEKDHISITAESLS
jgi:sensor domain CHASE-containing protein